MSENNFQPISVRTLKAQAEQVLDQFVGRPQSANPVDPVRQAVVNEINSLLFPLKHSGVLETFEFICDDTNNTVETIARNELHGTIKAKRTGVDEPDEIPISVAPPPVIVE